MSTTWLHRFSIKPHHVDDYLPLWERQCAVRQRHGYTLHRAFLETDAEPKLTWLYSHPDPDAEAALQADPETAELAALAAPHVFRNLLIRPVDVEVMTPLAAPPERDRLAVVRRYDLTGDWAGFLTIWRRIRPVREQYGFRCLFAVADRPRDQFTWAFDIPGTWADFPADQRGYYSDPERVALRGVFDHMADYSLHPARQLPIPGTD